jgi:hypothetical protein
MTFSDPPEDGISDFMINHLTEKDLVVLDKWKQEDAYWFSEWLMRQ